MAIASINPATGEVLKTFEPLSAAEIEKKIADIESAMGAPDFWSDKDKAQASLKEYQDLKAALAGNAPELDMSGSP